MQKKQLYGWMIVNHFLNRPKFEELTHLFLDAAKSLNIHLVVKDNADRLVHCTSGGIKSFFPAKEKLDFVLFWDKDILLARYLEMQNIPVYNSSEAIQICDDKRLTHMALMRQSLPMPETIFAPMTYANIGFQTLDFLTGVRDRLGFPMIVKEAYGSFGEQVYLVEDEKELSCLMSKLTCTNILFQEFIAPSKGKDIRLQVVGEEVVGAMYRYSVNDFRANVSAGGHMKEYAPDREECELAVAAAKSVGADFAGVDLLFGRDGPLVCEINSNAHFKNLMDCSGVDTAHHILSYIKEVSDDSGMVNL